MSWAFLRGIKRRGVSLSALFGLGTNDNNSSGKDFSYSAGEVNSSSSGDDSCESYSCGGDKGENETGDVPFPPHDKDDPCVKTSRPEIAGRKGGDGRRDPFPRPAMAVIEFGEIMFEVSDGGSESIFGFFRYQPTEPP